MLTIFFTHTILLSTMVQTFFFSGGGAGGCSFSTAGSNFSRTCVTVDNFVILPLSVLIKLLSTTSSSNFLRLMDLEEVLRGSWAEFWLWGGRSWLMRCFGVPSVTDPDWLCTEGRDSRDVDWSSSVIDYTISIHEITQIIRFYLSILFLHKYTNWDNACIAKRSNE